MRPSLYKIPISICQAKLIRSNSVESERKPREKWNRDFQSTQMGKTSKKPKWRNKKDLNQIPEENKLLKKKNLEKTIPLQSGNIQNSRAAA